MKNSLVNQICPFGFQVKMKLLEQNKTQNWLIDELKKATGLFVDSSVMHKLLIGVNRNPKFITAIEDILDIKKGQ